MQIPRLTPDIRLFGSVNQDFLVEFLRQRELAPPSGPIVLELSTDGGDADIGRRIAQELRLWQEHEGAEVWFLGKSYVFSAGITVMSAIPPQRRFLTGDCELLIHERKLKKELRLDGALRGCRSLVQDVLAEIESGQRLERAGFEQLVAGTPLTVEQVQDKVMASDWYLTAPQAVECGLVVGVV